MSVSAAKAEQPKTLVAADRAAPPQSRYRANAEFSSSRLNAAAHQQALIANSPRMQRAAARQALLAQSPRVQAAQRQALSMQRLPAPVSRRHKPNDTGLPAQLKAGVEQLSGYSLDDVRVHYNSEKPAQLQALAYAQGPDIHVAPGQEQHLAHEAWHVVQQKQGRVQPTRQLKGVGVNDASGLEQEADTMGAQAAALRPPAASSAGREVYHELIISPQSGQPQPVQRRISYITGKRYPNRDALRGALYAIFPASEEARAAIDEQLTGYENATWSIPPNQVFERVQNFLVAKGIATPSFAVAAEGEHSQHGAKMPFRVDKSAPRDAEKARSTFDFPSVTLARLTAFGDEENHVFHDRSQSSDVHAEDGLLAQFIAHIEETFGEEGGVTDETKINLTINNFFCSESHTGKNDPSNNCLDKIIALQTQYGFIDFHVYFKNPYGDINVMTRGIARLQEVGIQVSSFSISADSPPYYHDALDDASASEDEGSADGHSESEGESESEEEKEERKDNGHKRKAVGGSGSAAKKARGEASGSSAGASAAAGAASTSGGSGGADSDAVRAGRYIFSPNRPDIASGGQCFWDTLRHYGIAEQALADAAGQSGQTVDTHVFDDDIVPFLTALTTFTGDPYKLELYVMSYEGQVERETIDGSRRGVPIVIGLFHHEGNGHYVPPNA